MHGTGAEHEDGFQESVEVLPRTTIRLGVLPDAKNKIEEKTATLRTKLILHGNRDQAR